MGTGSSPALSIVRARANNKRADSRAQSAQQAALLRSEGTTCGNAIPLKEHKREQRNATIKQSKGEQDEESQSLAILWQRKDLRNPGINSPPHLISCGGRPALYPPASGGKGKKLYISCGAKGHEVLRTRAKRLWICFTNSV